MITPAGYQNLFETAQLTQELPRLRQLSLVCKIVMANQEAYRLVQHDSGVPWPIVAAIHFRESGQDFTKHLHNGDPLTAKTVHVPIGRPYRGEPPFTWPQSAQDALSTAWRPETWSTAGSLEFIERYNGLGYQKRGVNSPYLWDFTDKYVSGLFTADGRFNSNAREERPGAVSILLFLENRGVSLDFVS